MASNRTAGPEKISTQHEDIFEFGPVVNRQQLYVSGEVMDKESTADIQQVNLSLYEVSNGRERLLQRKKSNSNDYRFKILSNRNYRLVVETKGYIKASFDFNTLQGKKSIQQDFYLNKAEEISITPPIVQSPPPTNTPPKVIRTSSVPTRTNSSRPTTNTPKYNSPPVNSFIGTYYKVQLIAINYYNDKHPRYKEVKHLALIETEPVPNNSKIIRVLLSSFADKQQAKVAMQQARQYGFADAFMVKYRDGDRLGTVYD